MAPSVAASSSWIDPAGIRMPAGEVHAWTPGRNSTLCGLALSRSQLLRFSHVPWAEAQPQSGGMADEVAEVCRKCAAGMSPRGRDARPWQRVAPRP